VATALLALLPSAACDAMTDRGGDLRVMVPNAAGGGYDTTARILARAVEEDGIADRPEVFNLEGASGVVGLARTVHERGNADLVMMMGLGLVGAVYTNDSPVTLEEVTPVARLLSEPEVLLVGNDSPHRDLGHFVEAWRRDPKGVVVGGGSLAGGPDHLATHLVAEEVGIDPRDVRYRQYDGGGPLLAALFTGRVDVAVSGVLENIEQVRTGAVRVLAVTGDTRVPGVAAPTLREAGVGLAFTNWRGLVAPPGLSRAGRGRLQDLVDRLHASPSWRAAIRDNGWTDDYLTGPEFGAFLASESTRVRRLLGRLGFEPAAQAALTP
jgi:putative tricarboxylic transport membrane protein